MTGEGAQVALGRSVSLRPSDPMSMKCAAWGGGAQPQIRRALGHAHAGALHAWDGSRDRYAECTDVEENCYERCAWPHPSLRPNKHGVCRVTGAGARRDGGAFSRRVRSAEFLEARTGAMHASDHGSRDVTRSAPT